MALTFSLQGQESFQKQIGGLTFKLKPLTSTGWMLSLEDSEGQDYLYFVNPPLRFNGSQTLGAGYGETAKESLRNGRELRFLLSRSDYEKLQPVVDDALWPYNAKDPDHAADRYFAMLDQMPTGLLRLSIESADIGDDDKVNSANFRVEFIAPAGFPYDPSLSPRAVPCPTQK